MYTNLSGRSIGVTFSFAVLPLYNLASIHSLERVEFPSGVDLIMVFPACSLVPLESSGVGLIPDSPNCSSYRPR